MSNESLRDRIAAAIERGFNESANLNDYEAETLAMAQAIIDELRLEREVSPINVDCVRYVSKWELRKH